MRAIIQRVNHASVSVHGTLLNKIQQGYMILLGVEINDTQEDLIWLADKIAGLRIFGDSDGKMNLSVKDIAGEILLISQFTLHAQTAKGNRPSFIKAAKPEIALKLYKEFGNRLQNQHQIPTKQGEFGADMDIELLNQGPVTIFIDSKNRE